MCMVAASTSYEAHAGAPIRVADQLMDQLAVPAPG